MATTVFNPAALFQAGFGFIRTGVLKAAVDLELFTHIARGKCTAEAIARAAYADERAIRILLDALAAQGMLTKEDGLYALPPPVALLLLKDSPMYAGAFARIMAAPQLWSAVGQLSEIVRTGHPPQSMVIVQARRPE